MIFDIKELFKKGFVHIFSASFINKIIQFGITIILVRILTKFDYGNFVYAQNILNMFLLLQGLGTTSAVLQFCSENNQNYGKRISYVKFGLRIALIFNFFIGVLIIIFSNFYRFPFKLLKKY